MPQSKEARGFLLRLWKNHGTHGFASARFHDLSALEDAVFRTANLECGSGGTIQFADRGRALRVSQMHMTQSAIWRLGRIQPPVMSELVMILEVITPQGHRIQIRHLYEAGQRRREQEQAARQRARELRLERRRPYYCGDGPVPGVRKYRGGGRYFRRIHTHGSIVLAVGCIAEEGEVAPRGARRACMLPSSWDDVPRCVQKSWKSQRKGRKAWDRG